jgi:LemA protein
MLPALISLAVIAALFAATFAWIYNRLVSLRNRYRNGYAQIDVQLKRRYDLIPNLVETAKGYLKHEKEVLTAVMEARAKAFQANQQAAMSPGAMVAMMGVAGAEAMLGGALGRFMGVVEKYPDLKGDQTMANLMEELSSTENRVAFARQAYNDAVMQYNNGRESFPHMLVAGPFGFQEAAFFRVDDAREREVVNVSLQSGDGA